MADEQTRAKAPDAPTPPEAAKEAKDAGDPTFDRDRLINESYARFGQPVHVVAGAIANISKKKLTEAEVKAAVKAFLVQEVK